MRTRDIRNNRAPVKQPARRPATGGGLLAANPPKAGQVTGMPRPPANAQATAMQQSRGVAPGQMSQLAMQNSGANYYPQQGQQGFGQGVAQQPAQAFGAQQGQQFQTPAPGQAKQDFGSYMQQNGQAFQRPTDQQMQQNFQALQQQRAAQPMHPMQGQPQMAGQQQQAMDPMQQKYLQQMQGGRGGV